MKTQTYYYKEGNADKQYTATLDGKFVQCAWGRRGGTMQTKTYGPLVNGDAEAFYTDKLAEKYAKGYRPGPDATPVIDPAFVHGQSVKLAPAPPAARQEYRPMLLNEISEAELLAVVYDPRYWVEVKHDGVRCILHVNDYEPVEGFSRTDKPIAIPKTVSDAAKKGTHVKTIIDGEMVGDTFWAFDLLMVRGVDFRKHSLAVRKNLLREEFPYSQSGGIVIVESISEATAKFDMIAHAKATGAEGIVLKDSTAPYVAGRPNSGGPWLKYKFVATASVIVAPKKKGTTAAARKRSIARSVEMVLADGTELGSVTIPANHEIPAVGKVIECRYLYAHRDGSLTQAVYLGVREDIPESECTIDQLQFKGEER